MFKKRETEPSGLEKEIDALLVEMSKTDRSTKEYSSMADQLAKLYPLLGKTEKRVSPDTLAAIAGNLLGIVMILGHERAHVVTSKALGFVMKLR